MSDVTLINIKEEILAENKELAHELRGRLRGQGVFLVNLMSSPGSGKTSLILRTLTHLESAYRMAVIEGDVDSVVGCGAAGFGLGGDLGRMEVFFLERWFWV